MSQDDQGATIRQQVDLVWRVVVKKWWLILILALLSGAAAFGTAKMLSPVYEASTTVRILRERGLAETTPEQPTVYGRSTLQAETTWFTSRQVLEAVIQRLALADSPPASIFEAAGNKVEGYVRRLLNRPKHEDARFYEVLDRLRGNAIKVKELTGSNVLEIRVNWYDPEMTMRIANTLVDVFIEQFQEFNKGRSRQNRSYLEQQVQLVRTQLDDAEKQLVDFQKRTGLVAPDDKQTGTSQSDLQRIEVEKRQVQMQLATANAELEQMDRSMSGKGPAKAEGNKEFRAALKNPSSLLRTLMSQGAAATATAGENSLAGAHAAKSLDSIKDRISKELKRLNADPALSVDSLMVMIQQEEHQSGVSETFNAQLQVERESLAARITVYKDELARLEAESAEAAKATEKLPDELQQYLSLTREKRVSEELYTMLCQRLAGAQVDENSDMYDIRVFDLAQFPVAPLRPKPGLLAAVGLFMGLFVGVSVAFMVEYLNDSLRTTQDVQAYLGLPVLAEIPRFKMGKKLIPADRLAELVDQSKRQ